jgi:hypothetical protein
MANPADDVDDVGTVVGGLRRAGFEPILVGGVALVLLGSRRVTTDFDFVVAHPRERLQDLIDVFYDHGFELASRLNDAGDISATIDNRRVAAIRLRIDQPDSAFFLKRKTGIRIDVFFDFPLPASTLAEHATTLKVRSHVFHIASEDDLLRLKKIAHRDRSAPGDAEDIAFLEARRARK